MNKLNWKLFLIVLILIIFLVGIIFFFKIFFLIEPQITEPKIITIKENKLTESNNKTLNLPEPIEKKIITLILVGDIMLNRGVRHKVEKYGNGDYKFPFLKIAEELKKADLLFGNLEGPISNKGTKIGSIYSFRANPKVIEGLIYAGFDVLSVANNHTFDYGRKALEDTFNRLKTVGLDYVGGGFNEKEAYSPLIKEINNTKIAFLAYTNFGSSYWLATEEKSGIARIDLKDIERIKKDIQKAKSQSDILIVSLHSGEEYSSKPIQFQIEFSKTVIDAGADLVVGHHPHVIQPFEKYKEGYIAYSLGNFIFDQKFSQETMKGLMLKVLIKKRKIQEVIPIETRINQYFQPEILLNSQSKNSELKIEDKSTKRNGQKIFSSIPKVKPFLKKTTESVNKLFISNFWNSFA